MTESKAREIADKLIALGWEFKWYDGRLSGGDSGGWWVLPNSDDPVRRMRRGDPHTYYEAAITTWELYAQMRGPK